MHVGTGMHDDVTIKTIGIILSGGSEGRQG